jgi:broad specificity phosphatase PhoE
MKIRFFIFRHGETDWNAQRKFQGHTDIELNAQGEIQAQSLREKLNRLSITRVLCSDLKRALKTAQIATQDLELPFIISSDLREIHLGEAESLTQEQIEKKFGVDMIGKWRSIAPEDKDYAFPGGEVKSDHLKRVQGYLQNFVQQNSHQLSEDEQIAVSTHGGCVVRLVHACENAPATTVPIPNCVLYELNFDASTQRWVFVGEVI